LIRPALLGVAVLALTLTAQSVYAEPFQKETTSNSVREFLGFVETPKGIMAQYKETIPLHDKLLDYTDHAGEKHYVDYKIRQDQNNVYFEAAHLSMSFDKDSCTAKKYPGGKINSASEFSLIHTIKEAVDQTDTWYVADAQNDTCEIIINENPTRPQIITKKGDWQTVYDLDLIGEFEWTYQYTNNNPSKSNHKYGFTFACQGAQCDNILIDNVPMNGTVKLKDEIIHKTIKVGKEYFDPKNEQHDYLWALKKEQDKMIVDFTHSKGKLPVGQTLIVDPTFGPSNMIKAVTVETNSGSTGTSCPSVSGNTTENVVQLPASSSTFRCKVTGIEFNISTIPNGAVVTNSSLKVVPSVSAVGQNCDVVKVANRITTASASTIWNDITGSSTTYINNNSFCTSGGTKDLDLGTTADSDLSTIINTGQDYVDYGIKTDTMTRGGADSIYSFGTWSLTVTYLVQAPNPPTNLDCTSIARQVSCTWTASTAFTGNSNTVQSYYIGKSLNNATFTNKTQTGNVTAYLMQSYFRPNQLYYLNITAANYAGNSTSAYDSVTTDNIPSAPLNPYTTAMSGSTIKINWQTPSSNGNDSITGYRLEYCITCTSWSLLVNQTNTLNYNHTGLSAAQLVKYRVAAWNGVGLSPYTANFTGRTFEATTGSISLASGVVGDVIQLNGTITISAGSPEPINISQSRLYVNGVLTQSRVEDIDINRGDSDTLDPYWYQFTSGASRTFSIKVTASNSTGTVTISPLSNVTASREYDPDYYTAIDPAEGLVNATVSRSDDQDTVLIKINRDKDGNTFNVECLLQTQSQAAFDPTAGTWINRSGVGYYNASISGFETEPLYGTCYNSGELLTFQSYTNGSLILFGIQVFDDTYGAFLGVPVGVFFIVMLAGAASQRTAPTWIVILLAVAGVMATIGFFELDTNIWALSLVAGLLGLIVGRKWL
jgi:hypothetical protein